MATDIKRGGGSSTEGPAGPNRERGRDDGWVASLRKRRRLSTKASKVAPRKDTLSLSAPGVAGDSRNGEMPPDSAALRGKGFPLVGKGTSGGSLKDGARSKRTRSTPQHERRAIAGLHI